ncbi:hypothetical protein ACFLV0_05980 [Chloroflexota bacterium]
MKFTELGIVPSQFDQWSELVKVYAPDDFPAEDFFKAALNLHKLEEAEDKPFQEIAQEYTSMLQKVGEMRNEADLLDVKKKGLAGEIESLTSEVGTLEHKKEEIKSSFEAQCSELEETKSMVVAAKEEHTQLNEEVEDLLKKSILQPPPHCAAPCTYIYNPATITLYARYKLLSIVAKRNQKYCVTVCSG